MTLHPVNLAVRFLLEVVMWLAIGLAVAAMFTGWQAVIAGITATMITMFLWAGFSVPGDGSRNKAAFIAIPGPLRLFWEMALFAAGAVALMALDHQGVALTFTVVLLIHYAVSWERVLWLINADAFPTFGRQ